MADPLFRSFLSTSPARTTPFSRLHPTFPSARLRRHLFLSTAWIIHNYIALPLSILFSVYTKPCLVIVFAPPHSCIKILLSNGRLAALALIIWNGCKRVGIHDSHHARLLHYLCATGVKTDLPHNMWQVCFYALTTFSLVLQSHISTHLLAALFSNGELATTAFRMSFSC